MFLVYYNFYWNHLRGILFQYTRNSWGALGGWRTLYEISPKEIGRGHSIYFRRSTHSHNSSRGISEFSPYNSFFHEPNDPIHLSPGNFPFGAPRTYSPEPNLSNLSVICLGGSTCNGSYNVFSTGGPQTTRLQHRGKWASNLANLHPGTVVRVKDNNRPPQTRNMVVVEEVSTSRS